MKKHWLTGAAMLALVATSGFAADPSSPPASGGSTETAAPASDTDGGHKGHHKEWTLEEARKHAHERADKLDKMTPDEWAAHQKKRKEGHEKWKSMTPEQREAWKKEHHGHHHGDKSGDDSASTPPASGDQTPAAPAAGQ